ncbi:MAG: septal ring lytic transglycosylase RlpA family protein [Polyangiaceae bacterium]
MTPKVARAPQRRGDSLSREGVRDTEQKRPAARTRGVTIVIALSATIYGCGSPPPSKVPVSNTGPSSLSSVSGPLSPTPGARQSGIASYYADSLAGRPTASGEPYDPKDFTAAHRTLPFGTIVEVTREDGQTVRVRINDRGPFGKKKRILDLSRAAARAIGLDRAGIAMVTVTVISAPLGR